jgi:hypothetical protein
MPVRIRKGQAGLARYPRAPGAGCGEPYRSRLFDFLRGNSDVLERLSEIPVL